MEIKDAANRIRKQSAQFLLGFTILIVLGLLVSFLYALQGPDLKTILTITGVVFTTAGASALVGGLLGFLFGIPRSLQGNGAAVQPAEHEVQSDPKGIGYQQNTNLEQISDWLTKILVGVGLTQIGTLPGYLHRYSEFVAPGLGNFSNSKLFSIALLIYFLICGFLTSYLWTRLYLAGAFRQADMEALGDKLSAMEQQKENDSKALSMLNKLLRPAKDDKPYSQEEINEILKNASDDVRAQIYYKAESFRNENWQLDKEKMERTIMIFKGLIENDTNYVFYKNHGQLGFALMDQRTPQYAEAISEFTKAIKMRPESEKTEWLDFEGNRALCRIKHDKEFNLVPPQKSGEKVKREILEDLHEASKGLNFSTVMEDQDLQKWLDINGLTQSDLIPGLKPGNP